MESKEVIAEICNSSLGAERGWESWEQLKKGSRNFSWALKVGTKPEERKAQSTESRSEADPRVTGVGKTLQDLPIQAVPDPQLTIKLQTFLLKGEVESP